MIKSKKSNGEQLGFEAKLWQAADKLRNNMDAAEYKHVVLGLIFLKYVSDAFEELHAKLKQTKEKIRKKLEDALPNMMPLMSLQKYSLIFKRREYFHKLINS